MTNLEWNEGIWYLENAEQDDCIEHEGRTVWTTNMYGGRFLLLDGAEVAGQTDNAIEGMLFLNRQIDGVF